MSITYTILEDSFFNTYYNYSVLCDTHMLSNDDQNKNYVKPLIKVDVLRDLFGKSLTSTTKPTPKSKSKSKPKPTPKTSTAPVTRSKTNTKTNKTTQSTIDVDKDKDKDDQDKDKDVDDNVEDKVDDEYEFKYNYYNSHSIKELRTIGSYYELSVKYEYRANIINAILEYEQCPVNAARVSERVNLWEYVVYLRSHSFMKTHLTFTWLDPSSPKY